MALVVTDPAPFSIEAAAIIKGDHRYIILIVCTREKGFHGRIRVRVEGLPERFLAGATVPEVPSNSSESHVRLKLPLDAEPGDYGFALVGESTVDDRRVSNATHLLNLKVAESDK